MMGHIRKAIMKLTSVIIVIEIGRASCRERV